MRVIKIKVSKYEKETLAYCKISKLINKSNWMIPDFGVSTTILNPINIYFVGGAS